MLISIIVPAYKRTDQAITTIKLLLAAQLRLIDQMEIIVVDNSPNNNLKKRLALLPAHNIKYLHLLEKNIAKNKNIGAKKAKGQILIFCDSDIEIESNTILETINHFIHQKSAAAVGGKVFWKNNPYQKIDRPRKEDRVLKIAAVNYTEALYSRYFATYKKIFCHIGGYDEKVFYMHGEGSDLSIRYWRAGFPLTYNPKIKVHHVFDAPDSIALRIAHADWKVAKDYLLLAYKYNALALAGGNYAKTININYQKFQQLANWHIIQGIGQNINDICRAKKIIDQYKLHDQPKYNFKFLEVFSDKTQFLQCIKKSPQRLNQIINKQ